MRSLKFWLGFVLVAFLVACGGGGDPGSSSSTTTTTTTTTTPTLSLSLIDASGATLTSNAITKSSSFYAKAVVKDASGNVLPNALVSFSTDYTIATLAGSAAATTALTDSSGVAKVQISPLSLTTTGASTLTAAAYISGTSVSGSLNYGASASNVTLTSIATSFSTIGALETTSVTVVGAVNGTASSGVVVNFSAPCGSFSPSSGTTNGSGVISTTFQSDVSCGTLSPISLTASAVGAGASVSKSLVVTAARPANIVFTSATPSLMYVSSAASGNKTSVVKFQVVNSNGVGITTLQNVIFSLSQAAIDAGVKFSVSNSNAAQTVSTDGSGYASIQIASGTVPIPVAVTATLASDSTIFASSLGLAVTSGAATQNSASLSATKLSIEALNVDGVTTTLTMRVADRMGNSVPDGTVVNFVTNSNSYVQGTCTTSNSGCSVVFSSQGSRPANGRAVILAYLAGEESFIDVNGDNVWQSGETFNDLGRAFIDTNEDGVWQSGEQIIGTSSGSSACVNALSADSAIAGTCDGTWSGNVLVRRAITITLATSTASITRTTSRTSTGFRVWVHDANTNANANGNVPTFNAMPTGSTVSAAIGTSGATCKVSAVSSNVVNNSSIGDFHDIILSGDSDCTTVTVNVTVTTPGGTSTTVTF